MGKQYRGIFFTWNVQVIVYQEVCNYALYPSFSSLCRGGRGGYMAINSYLLYYESRYSAIVKIALYQNLGI